MTTPYLTTAGRTAPIRIGSLIAFVGVVAAFAFTLAREAPVGSVRGKVFAKESDRALAEARIVVSAILPDIPDENVETPKTRVVYSNKKGEFSLSHVPAGDYELNASTRAHSAASFRLSVQEGGATQTLVPMIRSESEMTVNTHQKVFSTDEIPNLAVTGYADWKLPAGADHIKLSLWKTKLSRVMTSQKAFTAFNALTNNSETAVKTSEDLFHPESGEAPQKDLDKELRIQDDPEGFYYQKIGFDKLDRQQIEHAVGACRIHVTALAGQDALEAQAFEQCDHSASEAGSALRAQVVIRYFSAGTGRRAPPARRFRCRA